jgi:hypothetical protein
VYFLVEAALFNNIQASKQTSEFRVDKLLSKLRGHVALAVCLKSQIRLQAAECWKPD